MARDAQYLATCGHLAGQEHDVTPVDAHAVSLHHVRDLAHDDGARRLNAQRLIDFTNVVAARTLAHHAVGGDHFPQSVALDAQLVGGRLLGIVDSDDGACNIRQARHDNVLYGGR